MIFNIFERQTPRVVLIKFLKATFDLIVGEMIEVESPPGKFRYQIEAIEH